MKKIFILILTIVVFAGCNGKNNQIVVGSKNFSEQVLLGEIIAQQIENKTKLKVQRKLNLGGSFICHQALTAGQIDTYVEYTGTALTAILKMEPRISHLIKWIAYCFSRWIPWPLVPFHNLC